MKREAKGVKSDMQTQIKCHKGVQVVRHFAWEAGILPTKRMNTYNIICSISIIIKGMIKIKLIMQYYKKPNSPLGRHIKQPKHTAESIEYVSILANPQRFTLCNIAHISNV